MFSNSSLCDGDELIFGGGCRKIYIIYSGVTLKICNGLPSLQEKVIFAKDMKRLLLSNLFKNCPHG